MITRLVALLGAATLAFTPSAQTVIVNELLSSNKGGLLDEEGDSPDWIELFNPATAEMDLTGVGVSDDHDRPFKWVFGQSRLAPGGYLILFASGKDRHPEAAAATNPALPGLKLWLDAGKIATNDTTQVRRSGSQVFVRRWVDQSGAGNHASQTSDTLQPLWLTAGFNGSPALRFDGVNDLLLLPRILATNNFCFVAIYRTGVGHEIDQEGGGVGGTAGQRYLLGAQHGGDFNAGAGLSVGTNGVSVYEHGSGYMPANAVYQGSLASGTTVVLVNYIDKKPNLYMRSLRVSEGVLSSRRLVNAPVEIGSGAYGAFSGDLAEVLLYDRALTVAEAQGVSKYFVEKYRLTVPQPQHTNFELSSKGERLLVTAPDGRRLDDVRFPELPSNVSYGRALTNPANYLFFSQPTPGALNSTAAATEFLARPGFSHDAGFYTNAFELTLNAGATGADIRYTIDGSEPTETSLLYTGPLQIKSRAGTPNSISSIPTTPGGLLPAGEVFKGWVIRARAFKAGGLPSDVVTKTYWVDPKGRGRYSLPVISLSTTRANFFDSTIGIYIPGVTGANYSQRGTGWERPVYVEFFETNSLVPISQEADVKIHGNTSQNFPIKGLDLDGTGGKGTKPFKYQIFPDRSRSEFEHILLRPTGHDQQMAFMRDELMQSLGAETGAESQAARACIVFINGEYWGLHYLKEKEDADFVAAYAGLAPDGVDFLEGYAAARAGDTAHYDDMIAYIGSHDLAQSGPYTHVQELMEVPSYIDYKATEIFFYRWDIGNHRLWRPHPPTGRWRWLQFDNDVGWGGFWAIAPAWQFNMLAADLTPSGSLNGHNNETTTFLLRRLVTSPDFRRDFINRFADLMNSTLLPTHTIERINQMAAILQPEIAEHTRRWRTPGSLTDWQSHVSLLRSYATNRPQYVRQHLTNQFKLAGTAKVSLTVSTAAAGSIKVSTLPIGSPESVPWSGIYFKGNPFKISATPTNGFRFQRWEGDLSSPNREIEISLTGDVALRAVFVPDQEIRFGVIKAQADGSSTIAIKGSANQMIRIESSSNFRGWLQSSSIQLNTAGEGVLKVTPAARAVFYRASAAF